MDNRENRYLDTAHLYDYDPRDTVLDDIPFYIDYAKKQNGNILELGCGTGRATIPLAENGFKIWGVDLSDPMLKVLHSKIEQLPKTVKNNIHISKQNMASFKLDQKFKLIFVPFRTFQSLTSTEEQNSCLRSVHDHLDEAGLFIVNVFRPYAKLDQSWVRKEEFDNWEMTDNSKGIHILRKSTQHKIDTENQIIYSDLFYYVTDPEGVTNRTVERLKLKYYYEEQLEELLDNNGLELVERFGYYDKVPVDQGKEIIFVCRKK